MELNPAGLSCPGAGLATTASLRGHKSGMFDSAPEEPMSYGV